MSGRPRQCVVVVNFEVPPPLVREERAQSPVLRGDVRGCPGYREKRQGGGLVGDGSLGSATDQLRVLGEHATGVTRGKRLERGTPCVQLGIVDQQIQFPIRDINTNPIPVTDQPDRSTVHGLGGDVAYA